MGIFEMGWEKPSPIQVVYKQDYLQAAFNFYKFTEILMFKCRILTS